MAAVGSCGGGIVVDGCSWCRCCFVDISVAASLDS